MKKILLALLTAFLFAVWVLQHRGVIDFGVIYIISRLWLIIPLWYGIKLIRSEKMRAKKSGIIAVVFSGFLLLLSIIDIFSKTQDYVFYIAIIGMLVFWPLVIIMFLISIVLSLFDKGEVMYNSIFSSRNIQNPELKSPDVSLKAIFGKLTFTLEPKDFTQRAIRLNVLAFFGKVEIIIPEGIGVLAESKTRLGDTHILETATDKIIGKSVIEKPIVSEINPRLLLVTSSWLTGNIVVKHAG